LSKCSVGLYAGYAGSKRPSVTVGLLAELSDAGFIVHKAVAREVAA
jgi:hypothetical protein